MKRPQWTDKTLAHDYHPAKAKALTKAAACLDLQAAANRRRGLPAREANYLADCLRRVAAGKTWAEAFYWPEITKIKGAK